MKTPRDILLAQHRAAEPKLDAIRRTVIADELSDKATNSSRQAYCPGSLLSRVLTTVWRELIFPSRRIWTGLAAAWVLIAVVNISDRDNSIANVTPVSDQEVLMTFKARQRLMGELVSEGPATTGAERHKTTSPEPRTELVNHFDA